MYDYHILYYCLSRYDLTVIATPLLYKSVDPIFLFYFDLMYVFGFLGGSGGKESACNTGDSCSVPGSGRSHGEGNGNPLQYSCLEIPWKSSLAGHSPWGPKELDMT